MPETLRTVQETFGHTVTAQEYEIVEAIRDITKSANPKLTPDLRRKLKAAFAG